MMGLTYTWVTSDETVKYKRLVFDISFNEVPSDPSPRAPAPPLGVEWHNETENMALRGQFTDGFERAVH
jgi:hypothetical protein